MSFFLLLAITSNEIKRKNDFNKLIVSYLTENSNCNKECL